MVLSINSMILWMGMALVTKQVMLVNVSLHAITATYMPSNQKILVKNTRFMYDVQLKVRDIVYYI